MSRSGTAQTTAANRSGRWVSAAPTRRPPFDPPKIARCFVSGYVRDLIDGDAGDVETVGHAQAYQLFGHSTARVGHKRDRRLREGLERVSHAVAVMLAVDHLDRAERRQRDLALVLSAKVV